MNVSPHTSLKHRIIGSYFRICRDVMKSKNRTLYYVDLFAGDGICDCKEAPIIQWEPPYFNNMKQANEHNLDLKCIFNDKDNFEQLSNRLKPYQNNIIGLFDKDANEIYRPILELIPPDKWSIFVLDPYNHSDLKFTTVEAISKHEEYDSVSRCVRKPELIITFMTYSMQQYLNTIGRENVPEKNKEYLLKTIDDSLGTNSWREKILNKNNEMREDKTNIIFLNIFLEQLGKLGYDTVYFHIQQTAWNSVLYYLIFATSIPTAYTIISEKFEPYIKQIQKDKWVKENFSFYKRAKARQEGNKILDDYLDQSKQLH